MNNPLITFYLFAYNQEHLVVEAIDGAFSQDYSPLEIILSDDSSTDNTFSIMQRMAAEYKGPHQVSLNRNETNLGIIGHVNRAYELSSGELIIAAAGDDISYSDRVTQTFELWKEHNFKPDLLYFNYEPIGSNAYLYVMDNKNHTLDFQLINCGSYLKGATAAWTKRLKSIFGPLPNYAYAEDKVISFRAALAGGIACKDIPVVKYRMDTNSVVHGKDLTTRWLRELELRTSFCTAFLADLEKARGICCTEEDCKRYTRTIVGSLKALQREKRLYALGAFNKLSGLLFLWTGLCWNKWNLRKKLSVSKHVVSDYFKGY